MQYTVYKRKIILYHLTLDIYQKKKNSTSKVKNYWFQRKNNNNNKSKPPIQVNSKIFWKNVQGLCMCLFLGFSFLFVCLLALIICKSQFNSRIRIESMKIFLWFPNRFHLTWWRKQFKCYRGGMNFFGQGVWMRWSKQIPFLGSPPVRPHPQLKWAWSSTHLQWLPVQLCRQGVATRHRTHSFPCMELFRSRCQYGDVGKIRLLCTLLQVKYTEDFRREQW